jgi:hypothetical protein
MTPAEILQFYGSQAAEARAYALEQSTAGNPFCLFNWGSVAKNQFYRALIGWRTSLIDIEPPLRDALSASIAATDFIANHPVGPERYLFDAVPGSCAGLLLDRPSAPVIKEACLVLRDSNQRGVTADAKATAWLMSALSGGGPGDGTALAAKVGKSKRSALWGETLGAYFGLLSVPVAKPEDAWTLTDHLVQLYGRRRRNAFIRGGPDYLGGEEPDIVIDGLLATIWHVRRWDPSGLTELGRLHALPPSVRSRTSALGPRAEPRK